MTAAAPNPSNGTVASLSGAAIAGVVSCLPRKVVDNSYFVEKFGAAPLADVVKMIGVESRRWVAEGTTTADLCVQAGQRLLQGLDWDPASVDGIIFVTQTPNYILPATACSMQTALGLRPGIAFDVNLGCSGYPYALWLAMTMVQSGAASRLLVAVGDTISRIVDGEDRATAMLFGDAGTVTAIERSADASSAAHFLLGSDGRGERNLIIPEGRFKTVSAAQDPRLDGRKLDCLYMDGGEIFNFTLSSVPGLVASTLAQAGNDPIDSYAGFLFHQANAFMLKHLIKKTKLPVDKAPINIGTYGNTSSASIPLLMTTSMAEALRSRACKLAMFGFGVGYSWAGASLTCGPLRVVETIET
jgi:3-oxoacyl-[acyl-carrier-protein] synthase-3